MFKTDTEDYSVVRGCEKRIYHVKNTESDIFDEAYFILKVGKGKGGMTPREMEREAMRLVNDTGGTTGKKKSLENRERIKAFILGSLFSGTTIGLVSLILWIVS